MTEANARAEIECLKKEADRLGGLLRDEQQKVFAVEAERDSLQRKLEWSATMLKAFGEAQAEWVREYKGLTAKIDDYKCRWEIEKANRRQVQP